MEETPTTTVYTGPPLTSAQIEALDSIDRGLFTRVHPAREQALRTRGLVEGPLVAPVLTDLGRTVLAETGAA